MPACIAAAFAVRSPGCKETDKRYPLVLTMETILCLLFFGWAVIFMLVSFGGFRPTWLPDPGLSSSIAVLSFGAWNTFPWFIERMKASKEEAS